MIQVVAHRGIWADPASQNSLDAIARSFELGFGVETDVRDHDGVAVIAHDPPTSTCLALADIMALPFANERHLFLNIKSDGLAPLLASRAWGPNAWFFDMSVPQMVVFARERLPFLSRISDIEVNPVLVDQAAGLWVDALMEEWLDAQHVRAITGLASNVAFVSPELHGRDPGAMWSLLRREMPAATTVSICTDLPMEARAFFNGASN